MGFFAYLAFFMVRTAPQDTATSASTIANALSPVGAGEGATGAVFVYAPFTRYTTFDAELVVGIASVPIVW